MDHNTCRDNLSAYLDGELPALEKALLEAHLADCPDCRAALGQLGAVSSIFKKHAMEPVPPALKSAVLGGRKAARPWLKPVLALSAAAAGVLVVINLNRPPEGSLSLDTGSFGSKNSMYEPLAVSVGGQALPVEEAPSSPAAAAPMGAAASVRGAYSQAKFAAPRAMGALSGGTSGELLKAARKPLGAPEFRGPVCVRVYAAETPGPGGAGTSEALAFLKGSGIKMAQAGPGRLVFVKNDGTKRELTETGRPYVFIFFDGVQDPLAVTDPASVPSLYSKYFGSKK